IGVEGEPHAFGVPAVSEAPPTQTGMTDVNAVVGGYLRDLAYPPAPQPKMFGYKRAAAAVFRLEHSLVDLVREHGAIPRIPGIGPASARVIHEVLDKRSPPTAEPATDAHA